MIRTKLYFAQENDKGKKFEAYLTINTIGFTEEQIGKELLPEFAGTDWKVISMEEIEDVTKIHITGKGGD